MEPIPHGEPTPDTTSGVLEALEDAGGIDESLAAFLQLHPHYEKHGERMRRECLLASAACALYASLISRRCTRAEAEAYTARFRAESGFEEARGLPGRPSNSDVEEIAAYLESFNYVYSQVAKDDFSSGREIASSLMNTAFLAVTRVFGNQAVWDGSSAHIFVLEGLFLPLLQETFERFSASRKPHARQLSRQPRTARALTRGGASGASAA